MSPPGYSQAIPATGPVPAGPAVRLAGAAGVVVALSAVIYGLSLTGQMGHWDDSVYVNENPYLLHPSWLNTWALLSRPYFNHWYPLTMITYVADYAAWGLNPVGYHLTSLAFHAAAGVLVYLVARRLSGAEWIALFTAALFTAADSIAGMSSMRDSSPNPMFSRAVSSNRRWSWNTAATPRRITAGSISLMSTPSIVMVRQNVPISSGALRT